MPGRDTLRLTAALVVMGAGWGLTIPLIRIIVTGGYDPFGVIFWQFLVGAVALGIAQRKRLAQIRVRPATVAVWVFITFVGTLIPNAASYRAAAHLPAGVMAIVIASIPMIAFPIALALGNDRFAWRRLGGLVLGLAGVTLIAAPEASLPDRAMIAFIPLALIAPLCYAIEGNGVARWGTAGLDPVQVMFGASVLGVVLTLPLALMTGQFKAPSLSPDAADKALILTTLIHVAVYTAYVWMVGRAGAVFAAQVSYLVTGFGVLWSMLILGERYSLWVWGALLLMVMGLALVQPRMTLAQPDPSGDTDPTATPEGP